MHAAPNNDGSTIRRSLACARGGDRDALGRLLAGFRGYLLAIARQELDPALRAKQGVSDVVQDTFVQAQRKFADFEGASEPELQAWLAEILRNRCRDLRTAHLGTAKRDARREVALYGADRTPGALAMLSASDPTPSKCAVAEEDAGRLLLAMERLPEHMREVVWLRNWQALSFEEVGRRTGRTSEAARRLFARAVQQLGRELEESDGDRDGSTERG